MKPTTRRTPNRKVSVSLPFHGTMSRNNSPTTSGHVMPSAFRMPSVGRSTEPVASSDTVTSSVGLRLAPLTWPLA